MAEITLTKENIINGVNQVLAQNSKCITANNTCLYELDGKRCVVGWMLDGSDSVRVSEMI